MARRTSWRFWNKKRLQFRGRNSSSRAGEWNVISEPTAAAMAAASPFDSCGQEVVLPEALDMLCPNTVKGVPIVLSSAVEGDLAGQPLWPNHTVTSIGGAIFVQRVAGEGAGNVQEGGTFIFMGLGIRKARFDYDAVTPSFETDFDPLHEDDMEERWIWRDVILLPPAFPQPNQSSAGVPVVYGAAGLNTAIAAVVDPVQDGNYAFHHGLRVSIKNRCVLKENEGLVLITSFTTQGFARTGLPGNFETLNHPQGSVFVTPFLRTYVKMHK